MVLVLTCESRLWLPYTLQPCGHSLQDGSEKLPVLLSQVQWFPIDLAPFQQSILPAEKDYFLGRSHQKYVLLNL